MADKPTIHDVMTHLDNLPSKVGVARAGMWGAFQGTAPRDRWDRALTELQAAADSLAAAVAALRAMDKLEPYCTLCGEPLLDMSIGWSHFSDGGAVAVQAGHPAALDWRPVGTPGQRTPLCKLCGEAPATDDDGGLCWLCGDEDG